MNEGDRHVDEISRLIDGWGWEALQQQWHQFNAYMASGGLMPSQWSGTPAKRTRLGRPPLPDGIVLDDVEHGTKGYHAGCRCTRCRRANADRAARYRAGGAVKKTKENL